MFRPIYFLFAGLLILFLTHCATMHDPRSETLMLIDTVKPNKTKMLEVSFHKPVGFKTQIYNNADAYYRKHPRITSVKHVTYNRNGIGISRTWVSSQLNSAISLAVGNILGADITTRLGGNFYITIAGTILGGSQFHLQKKLFNIKSSCLAMGVFYRRDSYYFKTEKEPKRADECCDDQVIFPDFFAYSDPVKMQSLGIRSVYTIHEQKNRSIIKMSLSYGYSNLFKHPVFFVGLGLGTF